MKRRIVLISLTSLSLVLCGVAEAQSRGKAAAARPGLRVPSAAVGQSSRPAGRISTQDRGQGRTGAIQAPRGTQGQRGIQSPRGNNPGRDYRGVNPGNYGRDNRVQYPGNNAGNGLLDLLNQHYGGRGYDPHAGDKAYAKAYRDAAIANAVVNLMGILVTSSQQRHALEAASAGGPDGSIVKERRLVQEARIEEYQVWVPEYRIPETNEIVPGHHETRRREIPATYEEREVWVPR